jgi:putative permease
MEENKVARTARGTSLKRAGPSDISDPLLREEARKAFVWIGLAALVVLAVFLAQPLLVIFGGMVFGAMVDGGTRLLGRVLPIGRGWRVGIVMILTLLFLVWVAYFAGSQIAAQAAALPKTIESQALRAVAWLAAHGIAIDVDDVKGYVQQAIGGVSYLTRAVGGLIGALTTLFLIVVLGIYFAAEPRLYQRGLAWILPRDSRSYFHETAQMMGKSLRRLLAGRLLGMAIEGFATWILLSIYGVPMAALLGLLTGLLAFLPNIGAPISGALMVLVGFSGGTDMGIYCIIVYVVVQVVDGNIIVPMVAKKTVDLAPALVLGAQLIMGALFGILGLALADPLVALLKIGLERQSAKNEQLEAE